MIRLHHVPWSRSFRCLWLLEELGLEYDVSVYRIGDGSMRTEAFLDVSPLGRVPALEFDGDVIFESPAIAQVLCEAYPEAKLAPQVGEATRAAYLQWMGFAETQASIIASLNLQMVFLRPPAKPSAAVLKLEVARLRASLGPLEQLFASQKWVLETGFSAADTMLGFNLFAAKFFVDMTPFAHIQDYVRRCEARPAYQRAAKCDGAQKFYAQDFYPVPQES